MGQRVLEECFNLGGTSALTVWLLTGEGQEIPGTAPRWLSDNQNDIPSRRYSIYGLITFGIPFRETTVSKIFATFFLASLMNFCWLLTLCHWSPLKTFYKTHLMFVQRVRSLLSKSLFGQIWKDLVLWNEREVGILHIYIYAVYTKEKVYKGTHQAVNSAHIREWVLGVGRILILP